MRALWTSFDNLAPVRPPLAERPYGAVASNALHILSPQLWRSTNSHGGDNLSGEEWCSLNAFVARLHAAAPDLQDLDLNGLNALLEALEVDYHGCADEVSALDELLPPAAAWVVYAGKQIRENSVPYAEHEFEGLTQHLRRSPWSVGEAMAREEMLRSREVEFLEGEIRTTKSQGRDSGKHQKLVRAGYPSHEPDRSRY